MSACVKPRRGVDWPLGCRRRRAQACISRRAARNLQLETLVLKSETPAVHWKKVTLIGVGLLGGSLGLALKRRRLADSVTGFVRRAASVVECEGLGAVHQATRDLRRAVADAELIVLCTPIGRMRPLVTQMLPVLAPGTILTDVGSVKGSVVRDLESLAAQAGAHFVGSHPMAGSEKTGVAAARADLFADAVCVITPTRNSHPGAVRKVEQLWKSVGARLLRLTPASARRFGQPLQPFAARGRGCAGQPGPRARNSRSSRGCSAPMASATRRASHPARPKCGATSRWPTARTSHAP